MEHSIIYWKKGVYACFPYLLKRPGGSLVTRFSTRLYASHVDHTGGTCALASFDGGRSWNETDEELLNPAWESTDGAMANADAHKWRYPHRRYPLGGGGSMSQIHTILCVVAHPVATTLLPSS